MPKFMELKVKIIGLVEEAKAHRRKELSYSGDRPERALIQSHRTTVIRVETRAALLAYALLRGRTYSQVEGTAKTVPDWKRVEANVRKHGNVEKAEAIRMISTWMPVTQSAAWSKAA